MEPAIKLMPGVSKWDVRQKVWDYMEENNLANFPRPVHCRIPNFKGAAQAAENLPNLQEFKNARIIKVNPDKPQENVRLLTLEARKILLVPTPRLRTGLFNKIVPPPGASKEVLRVCSTAQGVKDFSVPVGLDAKVHVDLVVVGSVAVSDKGWRIGKGEGFADLEYAMMVSMGAVDENTVVVTTVHDCQLLDIPEELMDDHDLTVDYILTPTQVIKTDCKRSKPQGIIWSKVDSEMMEKIPILKSLQFRERKAGKDVTLRDERLMEKKELQRLLVVRKPSGKGGNTAKIKTNPIEVTRNSEASEEQMESGCKMQLNAPSRVTAVYMGNIPHSLRVSELKIILRDHNALPLRLNWQGAQHRAFLDYKDEVTAEEAVTSLAGLSISGSMIRVELARSQRGNRSRSQTTEETSKQLLV
ncbi:methenyltetrahydrofolate synthase domain-containing protein isoform X4 [Carcharodon carcharias]|uniref:methenyltetrahydrofolate synthase domain-containing protein isoform X4 n=1 Tax=Carcharodon carcharias TaxID=13397 RepID=UPI001B7E9F4F|nr:methenyltetrahydrofolate synthase domain-containing protein isoform X4 [Carcharodon carcharias]